MVFPAKSPIISSMILIGFSIVCEGVCLGMLFKDELAMSASGIAVPRASLASLQRSGQPLATLANAFATAHVVALDMLGRMVPRLLSCVCCFAIGSSESRQASQNCQNALLQEGSYRKPLSIPTRFNTIPAGRCASSLKQQGDLWQQSCSLWLHFVSVRGHFMLPVFSPDGTSPRQGEGPLWVAGWVGGWVGARPHLETIKQD